jgi:hypothetical protein
MKEQQGRNILIFSGTLIIVGVAFVVGLKFFKAGQTQDFFRNISAVASVISPQPPSAPISAVTSTTTTINTTSSISKVSTSTIAATSTTETVSPPNIEPTTTVVVAPSQPSPPTPPAQVAQPSTVKTVSLPYSIGTFGNGFETGDGWSNWWGSSYEKNGTLVIGATSSTTGGGALLQGSGDWTDYTFQANVDWNQGETFGIVARYVSDQNYLVCQFDEKNVGDVHLRIDQHLDGNVTHLADGDVLNYNQMGGSNITVAISVQGTETSCGFNGYSISTIIASDAAANSSKGEIGFTTWDPNTNNSQIVVTTIGVVPWSYSLGNHVTDAP